MAKMTDYTVQITVVIRAQSWGNLVSVVVEMLKQYSCSTFFDLKLISKNDVKDRS